MSLTGIGTIFVTRSHSFFFLERPGTPVLVAFAIAQAAASVLGEISMKFHLNFKGAYGLAGFPSDGFFDFKGGGWGWVLSMQKLGCITYINSYLGMEYHLVLANGFHQIYCTWNVQRSKECVASDGGTANTNRAEEKPGYIIKNID